MYNLFKAEQQESTDRQLKRSEGKIIRYHRKYKTEIQPHLVEKYNKRINGFAKKMEDTPTQIKSINDPIPQHKLFRESDHSLNISQAQFRFRSSDDWKSIFTSSERLDRQNRLQESRKGNDNSLLAFRSIGSQSPYTNKIQQFRTRDRKKDINPPMKYTNKNSLMTLVSLPQFKKKGFKKLLNRANKDSSNGRLSRASFESQGKDSEMNVSQTDILSLYNYMMTKKTERSKTQKQILQEQQLKALAQNKLYFKSLIDLQQNVKAKKQKYVLKETLVRCGVIKKSKIMYNQQDEADQFNEMLKQHGVKHSEDKKI